MSLLSKSLEKRIQELTSSIESQKIELAAYQRVLQMELAKGNAPAESGTAMPAEVALALSAHKKVTVASAVVKSTGVSVAGSKTTLVSEIVRSHGSAGATPKDVDAYFSAKGIAHSKNLIYNTLSYLVSQKKLSRHDGKYFAVAGAAAPTAAAKKVAAKKTATPLKRRLSPEGLKRIKEALKKRWAAKKAAEAATKK